MTILYDFEKYSGLVVLHERWWCVPQGFICLRERDKFFKNGKRFPCKANSSPPSPSFKSTGEFLSKISFSWRGKLFLANLLGVVLHEGPKGDQSIPKGRRKSEYCKNEIFPQPWWDTLIYYTLGGIH